MSTYTVTAMPYRYYRHAEVPAGPTRVVHRTDDWVDAYAYAADHRRDGGQSLWRHVIGLHPSHRYPSGTPPVHSYQSEARCETCGARNNGCFMSHLPCGYVFDAAFVTILERERAALQPLTGGMR